MKNIFLIQINKPSRIYLSVSNNLHISDIELEDGIRYHLYITSDEEIKKGDWYLDLSVFPNNISIGKGIYQMKYSKWGEEGQGDCKKIILTTDQDLIANGVQAIDDEFFEWFVKKN